ncbi:MAG: 8-oxo-dGTP diphosphatase [Bacillota bacterium]|nr:8-oxo-dGTP diphosphatase [Bacillota bacterium]
MDRYIPATFTNMCMIYDEGKILVQDRVDEKWPGITFPGGHVENGESFTESVIREVCEETGLTIENPVLCGIKEWQNENLSRYVVLLYKANKFSGKLTSSDEGKVFWVDRADLKNYRLAKDFEDMLKVFEEDNLSEFYYCKKQSGWGKRIY